MTASTPIVRYYDHLRFVYEVESRMKELRRTSETQQQKQAPTQSQPEGETHRKDGGTKLNPNDAPQQTVNPPAELWGGDTMEVRLEPPPSPQPSDNEANAVSTPQAVSGLLRSAFFRKSRSAVRKGSKPCNA